MHRHIDHAPMHRCMRACIDASARALARNMLMRRGCADASLRFAERLRLASPSPGRTVV